MKPSRPGRILYDSARSSTNAGTRSGFCVDRTLVFHGDGLIVDVVLHAGTRQVGFLHGQVVRAGGNLPVAGAEIGLGDGGLPVVTDEHGQFAVASDSATSTQCLRIATDEVNLRCTIPGQSAPVAV